MRVVLDTNVLISACWSPGGLEGRLVALVIEGQLTACVTEAVMAEYRGVAQRPKFATRAVCFERMIASFETIAAVVLPGETSAAATDPDDNRLLECAHGGAAPWLITGNLRHFPADWPINGHQGTRIVNARQFFTANPGLLVPESPSGGP